MSAKYSITEMSITVKHKMKARKAEYMKVAVEKLEEFIEDQPA